MKIYTLVGAAILATAPAVASAAAFTDEAAWRAAVLNIYALETFDALASGSDVSTLAALNLRFSPLNDGTHPTVQRYSNTGGVVKSGPNNLLNDRDFALPARGPIEVTPLTPGEFLFGLGMWNVGGDDRLRLTFFNAAGGVVDTVESAQSFGFFGIVNSVGATRAVVDFVGGNGYAPTDDWQTAVRQSITPGVVPEPASWALLIAGFGLTGAAMRRRRTAVAA